MALSASTEFTVQLGDGLFLNSISVPVAAGAKCYKGGMVATFDGYGKPAVPAAAGSPEAFVIGKAQGTGSRGVGPIPAVETDVDNSAGNNGDKYVLVYSGVFLLRNDATAATAVTAADVGKKCYAKTDDTVSRDSLSGKRPVMGIIIGLAAASETGGVAGVWVQVGAPTVHRHIITLLSGADLSAAQYGIVKLSAGAVIAGAAADDSLLGIQQNVPAAGAGQPIDVCVFGPSLLKAGAGFTTSKDVTSDAGGLGVDAVAGAFAAPTVGGNLVAIATADATVNGGGYVQADVNTIVTLANAIKAYINGAPLTFWNALKADRASLSTVLGGRSIARALETAGAGATKMVFVNPTGRI